MTVISLQIYLTEETKSSLSCSPSCITHVIQVNNWSRKGCSITADGKLLLQLSLLLCFIHCQDYKYLTITYSASLHQNFVSHTFSAVHQLSQYLYCFTTKKLRLPKNRPTTSRFCTSNKHLQLYPLQGMKIHLKMNFGFGEALGGKYKTNYFAIFEVKEKY